MTQRLTKSGRMVTGHAHIKILFVVFFKMSTLKVVRLDWTLFSIHGEANIDTWEI